MSDTRNRRKEENKIYQRNLRERDNEKVKSVKRKSWQNLDPRKKLFQQAKDRSKRKGIDLDT